MKWTIHKAAIEWGIDRRTLASRLSEAGFDVERGAEFHTQEITRAVVGDLERERTRLTRADADIREMEKRQKEGELVDLQEVLDLIRRACLPISQRLRSLPADMATRCNPTDPVLAREALQRWVDDSLPLIRSQMPKPTKEQDEKPKPKAKRKKAKR
jgi:phage terminase Nu1 subunit (DNA packaging protein)